MNIIVVAALPLAILALVIIVWGIGISILLLTKFIRIDDVKNALTTDLCNFFRGVV